MKLSPFFLLTVTLLALNTKIFCQQPAIFLYPDGVPNSKKAPTDYLETREGNNVRMVTDPSITPYFPAKDKANGAAIVICPGGGYGFLAVESEGAEVARKFNEIGITAFVLKYRLPSDKVMSDKSIGPLQDAQRAVQLVRERSKEWGLNPAKIGIIGFSAGGHVASTAGTHFNKALIANPKNISLRPDFMMLIYPVITFGEFAHRGSQVKLIGSDASSAQIDLYSNEKQVTPQTPPTFLVHSENDKHVPIQNSLKFYEALLKEDVKAEMHLYQSGSHGYGLNNGSTPDKWFDRGVNFLIQNGFIPSLPKN